MKSYAAFTSLALTLVIPSQAAAESSARDSVKLEIRDGRPVVDGVYVNGHGPYKFLLDTGSTLNHLDPKIAKSIGLAVTFRTKLTSSTGVVDAEGSEGGEIRIGPAAADGQVFLFAGMEGLHAIGSDIQGVLGQVFLSRFDYLLDQRNRRVEFGTRAQTTGIRATFRIIQGRPIVATSLGAFVLDSGVHDMVRFGVRASGGTREMVTAAGSAAVGAVFSKLEIEGRMFWRGEAVALAQSPETGADGLLPTSAFKTIYVSNSEGYVVLD
jgi:hypothetical protein